MQVKFGGIDMRYDTLATFIYDENSGKVGSQKSKSVIEKIFCNVTELGAEKSQLVMGNLKDKTYVLRSMNRYEKPITYIQIGDSNYNITKRVNYDKSSTFYLAEQKGKRNNG